MRPFQSFEDKVLALNAAVEAARAGESAAVSEELNAQAEEMKGCAADLADIVGGKVARVETGYL